MTMLVNELDRELMMINGEIQNQYHQHNKLDGIQDFVIAYTETIPIACAALRDKTGGVFEVKRVYVRKEYRKMGIAKVIMKKLEEIAKSKNGKLMILETGKNMPAAHKLYNSLSYEITENYDQYIGMEDSICMKKEL